MNVGELRNAIENLPNDMPVFFRRVAPVAGNIETAGSANKDTFSSFGVVQDCLIIEPITDDEDGEVQRAVDQPCEKHNMEFCSECFPVVVVDFNRR